MKKIFGSIKVVFALTILISTITSCSKKASFETKTTLGREFFKSENSIFEDVQKAVSQFDKTEIINHIDKIEYFDAPTKSFALVYYQSNKGVTNIAFEKKYISNSLKTLQGGGIIIRCNGNCDAHRCQLATVMSGMAVDYLECTCSGCGLQIIKDIQ